MVPRAKVMVMYQYIRHQTWTWKQKRNHEHERWEGGTGIEQRHKCKGQGTTNSSTDPPIDRAIPSRAERVRVCYSRSPREREYHNDNSTYTFITLRSALLIAAGIWKGGLAKSEDVG